MKTRIASVGCILCILSVFVLVACGRQSHAPRILPATWQSNPTLVDQLATEVNLRGNYRIRPPREYQARQADALSALQPFGIGMYRWSNSPGSPNFSDLSVQIIKRANLDTATDVLKYELKLTNRDLKEFVHSKPEIGKINGVIFARAYWQGIDERPSGKYVTRGFTYASASPMQGIYISGSDTVRCNGEPCSYQPTDRLALPVAEAATMTFRNL